jgi:hypothetical protein
MVFAIDDDCSGVILDGFVVGRIAYLPLGSILQLVPTVDHVEALDPYLGIMSFLRTEE